MAGMPPDADQHRPLVVSLEIDEPAQARFDAERAALFPPGRTVLGAHITLFHAVPGVHRPAVQADLAAAAAARQPFAVEVAGLLPLGRGVAYRLEAAQLVALHRGLQAGWWNWLTAQDRQGLRPHVTVQNKAAPDVARRTLAELRDRFTPFATTARALLLWRYDGGPWTRLARYPLGTTDQEPAGTSAGPDR
ncbi:MAG: 2'-5' RNA ligase family protein [Actinobacteria bacterium]|nr:2'-5' RNA ligase family protein [Actinomycetota bacterium]